MNKSLNQLFTNNNIVFSIVCFALFGIFFGYLLRFDFGDEIGAALLGITCFWQVCKNPKLLFQPVIICVSVFFVFYTVYSFVISSNVPQAILHDLVVSLKPFIGFFGVFLLALTLSSFQRKIIRCLCVSLAIPCAVIALYSGGLLTGNYNSMLAFTGSGINFYSIIIVLATLYLFCSDFDKKSFVIFFLILSVGILSGRTKLYVFLVIALSLYLSGLHKNKLQINLKTALIALTVIAVTIIVAYPKIHFYFLDANPIYSFQDARKALYNEAFNLSQTYFPLGTGFAGFGSFASVKFLSPVYLENNLFDVLGLELLKGNYATDAFFASLLGQFGVVGVLAFFGFFAWIFKYSLNNFSPKKQYFTLLIILFFLSESFTNSTFTQSFGFIMMMILGYILSEQKKIVIN